MTITIQTNDRVGPTTTKTIEIPDADVVTLLREVVSGLVATLDEIKNAPFRKHK